jgi:hypothetical protein
MGRRYRLIEIHGKLHKFCQGPLHKGKWVPVTRFKIRPEPRTDGTYGLKAWCNACENAYRNKSASPPFAVGCVSFDKIRPLVEELEQRIGRAEAIRRTGIGKTTWYRWIENPNRRIQRAKAARVLLVLKEVRDKKEIRHHESIRRGASARGEIEKVPGLFDNSYTKNRSIRARGRK